MKKYKVTLHMDNGNILYLDNMTSNNSDELLGIILMSDSNLPPNNKFNTALSYDHYICYCVGKISSIHYKEVE